MRWYRRCWRIIRRGRGNKLAKAKIRPRFPRQNPPTNPPSTNRPFLRKQESIFYRATTPRRIRRRRHANCRPQPKPKSAHNSPSPTGPFLRRQESIFYRAATPRRICRRRHANCRPKQSQNPPTIPRPPADHSCVGRNLFFTGRHRRVESAKGGKSKNRPKSPNNRQIIAKIYMSYNQFGMYCGTNNNGHGTK